MDELIQDQDIVAKKLGRRTLIEVSVLKDYISQLPTFKSPSRNWGAADE